MACGYSWWQWFDAEELLDQSRIWKEGVPASAVEVQGRETTHKFVFHSYDLEVSYLDAKHSLHRGRVNFNSMTEGDKTSTPIVHYLENDPEHFALSWAMELKSSRWAAIAFMTVLGAGLIGGAFAIGGMQAMRKFFDARCCVRRCDEIAVRITHIIEHIAKDEQTGTTYYFTGKTVEGQEVSGKVYFEVQHEPLFADGSKRTAVALISPENPKRPVVPRDDFYPFDLSSEEQARARAVIAGRSSG